MKLSIRVENIEQIKRFIKSRPEELKKELGKAVKESALLVKKEAQRRTPVATGALRTSIQVKTTESEGEIFTNNRYAVFVHENLRARHPVGEAKYLSKAYRYSRQQIKEIFKKAINEIIK